MSYQYSADNATEQQNYFADQKKYNQLNLAMNINWLIFVQQGIYSLNQPHQKFVQYMGTFIVAEHLLPDFKV